jgi:hypothetical protein
MIASRTFLLFDEDMEIIYDGQYSTDQYSFTGALHRARQPKLWEVQNNFTKEIEDVVITVDSSVIAWINYGYFIKDESDDKLYKITSDMNRKMNSKTYTIYAIEARQE